jgi:hypothetical protein
MRFKIKVGEIEKHLVEFQHNQLLGEVSIKVDRRPVMQSKRLINEPVREVYRLAVGEMERSEVRIEKVRRPLLGTRNSVYVDNRLVRVFAGL